MCGDNAIFSDIVRFQENVFARNYESYNFGNQNVVI
jgi:hypothetical protein